MTIETEIEMLKMQHKQEVKKLNDTIETYLQTLRNTVIELGSVEDVYFTHDRENSASDMFDLCSKIGKDIEKVIAPDNF